MNNNKRIWILASGSLIIALFCLIFVLTKEKIIFGIQIGIMISLLSYWLIEIGIPFLIQKQKNKPKKSKKETKDNNV